MGLFSRDVKVTFINDATGEAFATTKMPPDKLPESFEIATTLHMNDADWSVVLAQPQTKLEFAKSRALVLHLRKIEKVATSDVTVTQATAA